jgi:cellulose synthase/poly-beta-1,6-N-acetylglucosamine synthase-like glycosyltransferase
VAHLLAAGGWDAFNVTEDADLGIRLSYFGYRTRMLPSLTLEEAPISLLPWLRQRTRWIKGYIQTWLVYMRDPAMLRQRLGTRGYYGFQFFVGAPALTFLLAPVFWGIFIAGAFGLLPHALPAPMVGMCMVSFAGGMASHLLFAHTVVKQEGWSGMGRAVATYPFYWLLHSLAAARALWQLAFSPHYWDKTSHGLSRMFKRA